MTLNSAAVCTTNPFLAPTNIYLSDFPPLGSLFQLWSPGIVLCFLPPPNSQYFPYPFTPRALPSFSQSLIQAHSLFLSHVALNDQQRSSNHYWAQAIDHRISGSSLLQGQFSIKHNCLTTFLFFERREYFYPEKMAFFKRMYLAISWNVSQTSITLEFSCPNIGVTFLSCCIYRDLLVTKGKKFCRIK